MVHSRCRAADSVLRRVEHRLSHVDRVIRDDLDAAAVPDSHLLIDQRGDGDGIVHGLAIAEGNELLHHSFNRAVRGLSLIHI